MGSQATVLNLGKLAGAGCRCKWPLGMLTEAAMRVRNRGMASCANPSSQVTVRSREQTLTRLLEEAMASCSRPCSHKTILDLESIFCIGGAYYGVLHLRLQPNKGLRSSKNQFVCFLGLADRGLLRLQPSKSLISREHIIASFL